MQSAEFYSRLRECFEVWGRARLGRTFFLSFKKTHGLRIDSEKGFKRMKLTILLQIPQALPDIASNVVDCIYEKPPLIPRAILVDPYQCDEWLDKVIVRAEQMNMRD